MNYAKLFLLPLVSLIHIGANAQSFTESSQSLGVTHEYIDTNIMGGGAAFFDFNNDGWEDIYITGGVNRDQLFQNDQTGNFTEVGIAAGLGFTSTIMTNGVIAGDVDNDGFRDIFITTSRNHHNYLLKNNGDNTFTDISSTLGTLDSVWSMTSSFGDVIQNGQIDIYVGNYVKYIDTPFYNSIFGGIQNEFYNNTSSLPSINFNEEAVAHQINNTGSTLATTITDYDSDWDKDILVGNDFGSLYGANTLYRNNDDSLGSFSNNSVISQLDYEINAMGIAIGDYDEDKDLDYYITNMMGNLLHTQGTNGVFSEDAISANVSATNVVSWGTFFFDYDNDTYLDLFTASGGIMFGAFPEPNRLFQNQQNGTFTEVSLAEGIQDTCRSRGALYGDIDNDGDLDVLVINTEADLNNGKNVSLYRNNTDGVNNWIKFKLIGTLSSRDAFGSQIEVKSNGRTWIREIDGGSTYLSHNSSIAHFGLGQYNEVDTVIIHWASGQSQIIANPNINALHVINESDIASIHESSTNEFKVYPNPTNDVIRLEASSNIDNYQYEILDLQGKILKKGKVNSMIFDISLKELQDGAYFVRLFNEKFSNMTQVILIR